MLKSYLSPQGYHSYLAAKAEKLKQSQVVDVPHLDDNPVRWIHDHFHIPETNAAIRLEPYQEAVISEALRRHASGDFVYSTVLYSDLKKSAKSTIAAAVVLWLAWQRGWETARIVGNDLKQADSRTFYYIRRALELNRKLGDLCKIKLYNIELPNKTTVQAIPVDPGGEAGGGDLITCFTELWAAKSEAANRLWTETTLSPLKLGRSLRWCESYAGYVGESKILENLHTIGVTNGSPVNVGIPGLELYANGRTLAFWNTTPRCHWQTEEYYDQERAVLDDKEFSRIHRNQWTSSKGLVYDNWSIENISELADYDPALGSIFWGCDDGYAQGQGRGHASYHPRVILLGQLNSLGGLNIFYEYVRTGVSDYNASINEVASTGYPKPEAAYVDSSAPAFIGALWNHDIHATRATHPVGEGIKNMRRLICDASGKRLLFIHPRCTNLIYSLTHYKYADTVVSKGGESNPLKVDDNEADALRYLAWPLRHPED